MLGNARQETSILANHNPGECDPNDDQDHVQHKEVWGRESEKLHADKYGERRDAVPYAHEKSIDRRLALVRHLCGHRQPEHMPRRVIDRIVCRILSNLHEFDDGEDRYECHRRIRAQGDHRQHEKKRTESAVLE